MLFVSKVAWISDLIPLILMIWYLNSANDIFVRTQFIVTLVDSCFSWLNVPPKQLKIAGLLYHNLHMR